MIIDSHQHFWQYDAKRHDWITDEMKILRKDYLPADALPVMQEAGVQGCVAVQADQSEAETEFLLQQTVEHPFIKAVVGWVDLRAKNLQERLDYFKQFVPLKGFRHVVQGEADDRFIMGKQFTEGVAMLEKYGYTYDILIFPKQLPAALEFAKQHDKMRLVIDHGAKPNLKTGEIGQWLAYMQQFAELKHVGCKISGLVTEADWKKWNREQIFTILEALTQIFGPSRLMFGSDYPVCKLATTYLQWMELCKDFFRHFSEAEKQMIFGGNAIRFYNIN